MKRRAFTLMELLLVVAILAIISAAAAPTFTSGSADAIEEARKSNFLAAYENTVSGANLMMAMLLTNFQKTSATDGQNNAFKDKFLPEGLPLDNLNQWKIGPNKAIRNLNYYIPVGSRVFYSKKGTQFFISAKIGNNQNLVLYWVKVNTNKNKLLSDYHGDANNQKDNTNQEIHITNEKTLDDYWKEVRDL